MIAVAMVGLLAGGIVEAKRRRARFHQLVVHYTQRELQYSVFSYSGPGGEHMRKQWAAHLQRTANRRVYYAEMRQKYRLAEKYPWLPVAPDPPPPK
jgi:hypothetical protein